MKVLHSETALSFPFPTFLAEYCIIQFMQRASISSPATPNTISTPPSSKRQKLSHDSPSILATSTTPQTPLDTEEARIQAAIDRIAAERGETKWSFAEDAAVAAAPAAAFSDGRNGDVNDNDDGDKSEETSNPAMSGSGGLKIIQASWSDIDGRQGEKVGRRTYGVVNHTSRKRSRDDDEEGSSSSEDEDEGDDTNATGTSLSQLIHSVKNTSKAQRKAARKAEKAARKKELVEKEVRKKIKLSKLTSISGTGGAGGGKDKDRDVECFTCGEKGHRKAECPQRERKSREKRKKGKERVTELDY